MIDPLDEQGWFHTGDLGHINEDGTLHIDGRQDDVIITGGEKVWPTRLEALLETHPTVSRAAVGALADPDWGQTVIAYVVPTHEESPRLDQLRDFVKSQLASWYAPKHLELVQSLPLTALGKLDRRNLNKQAMRSRAIVEKPDTMTELR